MTPFPQLSTTERDRRWALAQRLAEDHDLAALLVYGEPEGSGVPHFAADHYFTNERPGSVVLIPRGGVPLLFAPVHLAIGAHLEARHRDEQRWLEPEQFITHLDTLPAGAARGGTWIAECLRKHGLDRGRIGVIGLGAAAFHADGIIPARTWRTLHESLPAVDWVPVDPEFFALSRQRSAEERELLRWCAQAGERMCRAMLDAAGAGVPEQEVYAAGIAESLRAGAHNGGSVLVVGAEGETLEWGPPDWTYRAGRPRTLAHGDILLAELFPVYGMLETQQQLAVVIGDPHQETDHAATAARASYEAAAATMRPGVTFGAVLEAMFAPIEAAGGWNLTPLIHSLNPLDAVTSCGLPNNRSTELARYGPVGGVPTVGAELVLEPGMTFALESNCVLGTVLIDADGTEELNTLPCALHTIDA